MLTKSFLLQAARDHSLTQKQIEVFLRKILEDLPYDAIATQIQVSKPACLKRMGEVYDKFGIEGSSRGKEQRLKKVLREKSEISQQLNTSTVFASTREANAETKESIQTAAHAQPRTDGREDIAVQHVQSTDLNAASYTTWAMSLKAWFDCLGFQFEGTPKQAESHFEWVISVKARRGWDRIVVHGVQGEVQSSHIRTLRNAVHENRAAEGWAVAPRRISQFARQEVTLPNNNDLFCYTFDELIDQDVNFESYFDWLETTVKDKGIASNYVQLSCAKAEFLPDSQEPVGYSYYRENEGWIDGYIDLWLDDPTKEHISVLGEFGTGKTWFACHYAWRALQKYKLAKQKGLERPRLPLLIQLRNCTKSATVESLISEYFLREHKVFLPD